MGTNDSKATVSVLNCRFFVMRTIMRSCAPTLVLLALTTPAAAEYSLVDDMQVPSTGRGADELGASFLVVGPSSRKLWKTTTCLCVDAVNNEDNSTFQKMVDACDSGFNSKYDEKKKHWGGCEMGRKG